MDELEKKPIDAAFDITLKTKTFLSSFLTQNRNQILLCPVDCNTSFPPFLLGMKGKSCALNAYTITISLYLFGTDSSVRLISTASSFGRS